MRSLASLPSALLATAIVAQCPFDPTVLPSNLILCPNITDVLVTQSYDSYQWYKNGNAIPGANGPTLQVEYFQDAGSMFSVEATDSGCTEMSPAVLVDGWVFLPVTVQTTGDPLQVDSMANFFYCEGDTAILILGLPYDTNIQWYNNGQPIPGANDDTLVVTTTGVYYVSGAPSICPAYQQTLGVLLDYTFIPVTQPQIVQNGNQLCASPPGGAVQWYFNGAPIVGGNCINALVAGTYTVNVDYGDPCQGPSEPYDFVLSVPEPVRQQAFSIWPVPANDQVTITAALPYTGRWQLLDVTGRTVQSGSASGAQRIVVDLRSASSGRYWFSAEGMRPMQVSVMR